MSSGSRKWPYGVPPSPLRRLETSTSSESVPAVSSSHVRVRCGIGISVGGTIPCKLHPIAQGCRRLGVLGVLDRDLRQWA